MMQMFLNERENWQVIHQKVNKGYFWLVLCLSFLPSLSFSVFKGTKDEHTWRCNWEKWV